MSVADSVPSGSPSTINRHNAQSTIYVRVPMEWEVEGIISPLALPIATLVATAAPDVAIAQAIDMDLDDAPAVMAASAIDEQTVLEAIFKAYKEQSGRDLSPADYVLLADVEQIDDERLLFQLLTQEDLALMEAEERAQMHVHANDEVGDRKRGKRTAAALPRARSKVVLGQVDAYRVELPDELGGGFLSLRVGAHATVNTVRRLALDVVGQRRIKSEWNPAHFQLYAYNDDAHLGDSDDDGSTESSKVSRKNTLTRFATFSKRKTFSRTFTGSSRIAELASKAPDAGTLCGNVHRPLVAYFPHRALQRTRTKEKIAASLRERVLRPVHRLRLAPVVLTEGYVRLVTKTKKALAKLMRRRTTSGREGSDAKNDHGKHHAHHLNHTTAQRWCVLTAGSMSLWTSKPRRATTPPEQQILTRSILFVAPVAGRMAAAAKSHAFHIDVLEKSVHVANPERSVALSPRASHRRAMSEYTIPTDLPAAFVEEHGILLQSPQAYLFDCKTAVERDMWIHALSSAGVPQKPVLAKDQPLHTHRMPLARDVHGALHRNMGAIRLMTWYDSEREVLGVTVLEARGLPAMDSNGLADPCVRLQVLPVTDDNIIARTAIKHRTLNPLWNESFQLPLEPGMRAFSTLSVTLWDYDRFSGNDKSGVVTIDSLVELPETMREAIPVWYAIHPLDYEPPAPVPHFSMGHVFDLTTSTCVVEMEQFVRRFEVYAEGFSRFKAKSMYDKTLVAALGDNSVTSGVSLYSVQPHHFFVAKLPRGRSTALSVPQILAEVARVLELLDKSPIDTVHIFDVPLSEKVTKSLVYMLSCNNSKLHSLSVCGESIVDAEHLEQVLTAIDRSDFIDTVNLQGTKMPLNRPDLSAPIIDCIKSNLNLADLRLPRCALGSDGAESLAAALAVNCSLTRLDLSGNALGDAAAEAICEAVRFNRVLLKLSLEDNNLSAMGSYLPQLLSQNTTLRRLDVSKNRTAGLDGARAVASLVANNSVLTHMRADQCSFGVLGASILAAGLQSARSLVSLGLAGNTLGGAGVNILLSAIVKRNVVQYLDLSRNQCGESTARDILSLILKSETLVHVNLAENALSPSTLGAILRTVRANQMIRDRVSIAPLFMPLPVRFGQVVRLGRRIVIRNRRRRDVCYIVRTNRPSWVAVDPCAGFLQKDEKVVVRVLFSGNFSRYDDVSDLCFFVTVLPCGSKVASAARQSDSPISHARRFWRERKLGTRVESLEMDAFKAHNPRNARSRLTVHSSFRRKAGVKSGSAVGDRAAAVGLVNVCIQCAWSPRNEEWLHFGYTSLPRRYRRGRRRESTVVESRPPMESSNDTGAQHMDAVAEDGEEETGEEKEQVTGKKGNGGVQVGGFSFSQPDDELDVDEFLAGVGEEDLDLWSSALETNV